MDAHGILCLNKKKIQMKKLLILALALSTSFGSTVFAQTPETALEARPERNRGDRVAKQVERLTEALNLSEEQVAQVEQITKKTMAKMQSLRGSGNREANREKGKELMAQQDKAIEALLDKKQLKRYQNYKKRREERGPRRGGRRDGGK